MLLLVKLNDVIAALLQILQFFSSTPPPHSYKIWWFLFWQQCYCHRKAVFQGHEKRSFLLLSRSRVSMRTFFGPSCFLIVRALQRSTQATTPIQSSSNTFPSTDQTRRFVRLDCPTLCPRLSITHPTKATLTVFPIRLPNRFVFHPNQLRLDGFMRCISFI